MEQLIYVAIFVTLGYIFGRRAEQKHFKSLIEREQQLNKLPAMASRMPPQEGNYEQVLVSGSVVIANDYLRLLLQG